MSGGYRPPYRERDSHRDRDRDRERNWERDREWGRDRPRGDSRRDRDREWEDGGERRDSRLDDSRRRYDAHPGLDRPLDGGYDRDRDRDWPRDRRGPPPPRDLDRRDPFPPRDARRDDRDDGRPSRSYQDSDRYNGPPRGPRNGCRPSRSRSPPSRREGSPGRFRDAQMATSSSRRRSVSPSSQSSSSRRQLSMHRRPSPAPLAVERTRRPRSPPESGEEMTESPLPTRTPSSAASVVSGTLSIRGAAMTAAASTSQATATTGTTSILEQGREASSSTAPRQSDRRSSEQPSHGVSKAIVSRDASSGGAEPNSSIPATAATPDSEWSGWKAGPAAKPDTVAPGDIRPPTGPRAMQQQAQRPGIANSQGRQYGDRQGAFRRESSPSYRNDRLSVSQQPSRSSSAQGEETRQAPLNDGTANQARPSVSLARGSPTASGRAEREEGRAAWPDARSNAPPVHTKFDSSRDSPLEKGGDWGESSPSAHTARHEDDEAWGQSPSTSTRPDYRGIYEGRGRPSNRARGSYAPRGGARGGPARGGYGRDFRHSSYRGELGSESALGPGGGEVKKAQPISITSGEDAESALLRRARWTTLDEAYLKAAAETRKALRDLDVLYGELAAANLNRVLRQQHLNTYKDTFSLGFTGSSSGDAAMI